MDAAKGKVDEDLDFAKNILPDQGEMTRDALAQLLLCYIGTAADIIEFFDSFKVMISLILQSFNPSIFAQDPKVNTDKVLCLAVMCIWSWSLMQFTIIVPASKVGAERK